MSQVVQDERRERLTRVVASASLAASCVYIGWRWGWTLDAENLWFSLPLVLAETYGVLVSACLTYTAWNLRHRQPLPPLEGRTVDVFVTVADEPIAIIRKTALAAREIRYPHTTWLLDDGHRDELRAVAEELGIRYLRRQERLHGKAGNLNHALRISSGEFILQLDADHVPLPHMVDRLIGFFADERLAVAQSPQDFYNTDAFSDDAGRGRQLWGDQQLFFNVLQPGKDRVNAAMFVGSCAMLRRAAIEDVGGFATHTSTVGTETSLLLHARGWRSAYLNESLAFGLAPGTAHAYQVQQLHRAQGGMQLLRRYQPLAMPGLTPAQRLEYFETVSTPLGSVQRLVIYLAPIVFLTTGAFPIRASVGTFALFFIPAVVLRAVSFKLLTRGQGSLLLADRYWMAKWFTHLVAVRAWLGARRLSWRPRPDERGTVPLRTVAPQLALIGITAAALGWAIYARTLGYGAEVPGWGLLALFGAVALALWHAALAAHVVQLSLAGRHRRAEHRFAESLSVELRVLRADNKLSSTDIAMTEDLTATGLALRCMYPVPEGARVELTLPLSGGNVEVRGHVVRHATSETQLGTVHVVGVEFDGTSRETRDAIELHCAQHAMPLTQQRMRKTPAGVQALRRLRDLRGERRVDVGMPARVMVGPEGAEEELGVGLLEDVSPRGGRVVVDHPVSEGSWVTLQIPGSTVRASGRVVFVHALQTGLGMRFVVGFATAQPAGAPAATPPWYAAIVRLAAHAGSLAASGSSAAAGRLAKGSATAASQLAKGSRTVAGQVAKGSRTAAGQLAGGTRAATEKLSAGTRAASERLATTSRDVAAQASRVAGQLASDSRVALARAAERAKASRAALEGLTRVPLKPMDDAERRRRDLAALEATPPVVPAPAPDAVPLSAAAEGQDDPERAIEMEITGEFSFPFELAVGATLLITETGSVSADIAAVHAIVEGSYRGTLRATRSIRVGPAGRVDGVLEAPHVHLAPGALVNGVRVEGEPPAAGGGGGPAPAADDVPVAGSSSGEVPSPPDSSGATAAAPDPVSPPAEPVIATPPDEEPVAPDEDEIFVASPIFTDGVSRG